MEAFEKIRERFEFSLPDDYLKFWNAGILVSDKVAGLWMSRYWWLTPDKIADIDQYQWPFYKIRSLVPCARTPGGGHYCWFVEKNGGVWIAECPRDSDFAEGFAPNFEGFVFRSLIEEFTGTWHIKNLAGASAMFQRYAEMVRPLFRPRWADILANLASRRPVRSTMRGAEGCPCVLTQDEASEIVRSELAFPNLGKEFRQHVP